MKTQNWHGGFLQALEEIANTTRQRQSWVDLSDSLFPSPTELVCQLFDDSGVNDLLEKGIVFSEDTDAILRRLSSLAGELDLDISPEVLLSSAQWIELTYQAARALDMVRADLAQ